MKLKLKISTLIFLMCFLFQNSYSQQNVNGWYWMNGQPQSNTLNFVKIINTTDYIAVGNTGTFMKSTDGGDTWLINSQAGASSTPSLDYGGTQNLLTAYFFDANTGLVGGSSAAAYGDAIGRTTDGGATFTRISLGLAAHQVTGFYFINSTTGFASGNSTTKLVKTTDAGITWNEVPNVPASLTYNSVFAFDENRIFITSSTRRVVKTTDGGASWVTDVLPGTLNTTITDIGFKNANTGYVTGNGNYFGLTTDGTMLFSSNGGVNWVQQATNSSQPTNNIQMLNSTTGFAVSGNSTPTAQGILVKTTNAGTNWVPIVLPSPYSEQNAVDLEFINENTGWIIGGKPFITGGGITCIKTTNGGTNWVFQPNDIGYAFVSVDIDMADANTGYFIAGTTAAVFKTTNGGNNWNKLLSSPAGSYNKIQALSASTVILSGSAGLLTKTTNGGTSWNPIATTNPNITFFAMQWTDEMNGTIGGTGGYLAKTTNGGINWKTFNSGGSTIRNISMRNRDSVFAVSDINGNWQVFRYYDPVPSKLALNLTVGIEGFWNGTTQVTDTVKVTLRSQTSPYNIIDQSNAVISNAGYATFTFSSAPAGNYYLQINQRNSIETWSGAPVFLGSNANSYNFTTASAQAYGSNMVLKLGKYCDYSGDVNQSGNVDLTDLIQIYNAAAIFTSGYVAEDVNGDDIVDLTDLVITYNNAANFLQKVTP